MLILLLVLLDTAVFLPNLAPPSPIPTKADQVTGLGMTLFSCLQGWTRQVDRPGHPLVPADRVPAVLQKGA